MKIFTCSACNQSVFFENVQCTRCGHMLAYLPDHAVMSAIEIEPPPSHMTSSTGAANGANVSLYRALSPRAGGARYRLCTNYSVHAACNWAVPEHDDDPFCRACRLNEMIPNLADAKANEAWRRIERAKRRLLFTLMELGLPVESKREYPDRGLAFSFKGDEGKTKVFTGHSDGLVTINIAEADAPFREKMREQMGEGYRTLLGHFRHEIGHFYWDRLIRGSRDLDAFRALFGDEQIDYAAAMERHYREGARPDWASSFVSAYASMHPWEDWAETWAHYLHMVDTLDTARTYGLALRPEPVGGRRDAPRVSIAVRRLDFDDFDDLKTAWVPLTLALNSLNRGMGLPDLYPFALADRAITKLRFVHEVIERAQGTTS